MKIKGGNGDLFVVDDDIGIKRYISTQEKKKERKGRHMKVQVRQFIPRAQRSEARSISRLSSLRGSPLGRLEGKDKGGKMIGGMSGEINQHA